MLHNKTCNATSAVLGTDREKHVHPVPDKLTLMRRIALLENDLAMKQKYAQEKSK